jgi:hypothetical protein
MPKVDVATKLVCPTTLAGSYSSGLIGAPPEPHFCPKHQLNPLINTPVLLLAESVSLASKVLLGLSGVLGVARAWKLCQNLFGIDGGL